MFKKYHKRGYTIDKRGYVHIWKPDHPFAKNGYIKRSRFVMEKHLERLLKPKEVVHHINGIKNDDRIENLKLFKTHSKHIKGHPAWNKGLNVQTNTGRTHFKKGCIPWSKGKKFSKEYCRKLSETHKGQIPWNKGRHIYCGGKRFKKGHTPWNKGKPYPRMIGNTYGFKKGHIPWNKKSHN